MRFLFARYFEQFEILERKKLEKNVLNIVQNKVITLGNILRFRFDIRGKVKLEH